MLNGLLGALFKIFGTIALVNRVAAALVLWLSRRGRDPVDDDFEPTVEVVVPMYNEGVEVRETVTSLLELDYPKHKLCITFVDDASSDDSVLHVLDQARFAQDRLRVLRSTENQGKRLAIIRAVRESTAEIIVSVDSDVVVDRQAIRQLVRRFTSPRIAAVGGRVDVRNKHKNWLTRMEVIRYWYNYYFGKSLELFFRQVMCLSGCLTAYRRHVLLELEPKLIDRKVLGVPVKYGEDRFLTGQIIYAGYQTVMTTDAVCKTLVPETFDAFQLQQLRWQRSRFIDLWPFLANWRRIHPLIALQFITLYVVTTTYPILLVRAVLVGTFASLLVKKLIAFSIIGIYYRFCVRGLPAEDRVSPLAALPLIPVLPIIYGLLAPLALFTLDSTAWCTRQQDPDAALPAPEVAPEKSLKVGGAGRL